MIKVLRIIFLAILLFNCESNKIRFNEREKALDDSLKSEQDKYIILTDSMQINGLTGGNKPNWTPTEKQIKFIFSIAKQAVSKIENKYTEHLRVDNLDRTYKQLICYVDNNKDSLVLINGICRITDIPRVDL